jgi:dephospho-CoA kinase
MLRIGLTGGIGSGKSTVAALFATKGVPVIDTDEIARDVVRVGSPTYAAIINTFGKAILDEQAAIDRARLRERVFSDPGARRQLEVILHPRIRSEVETQLARLNAPFCILVVPLLIETDFHKLVDRILVVDADEASQIARTMARSGLPRTAVEAILAAQTDRATRRARADDLITNSGDVSELAPQVDALHDRYLALSLSQRVPS